MASSPFRSFFAIFFATTVAQASVVPSVCPNALVLAQIAAWPSQTRVLVVVDGYSDGARYALEVRRLYPDVKIVHLQSAEVLPEAFRRTFRPDSYDARLVFAKESWAAVVETLARFRRSPLRIVAGCETGVPLMDRLSEATDTTSNGTAASASRRDKWLMERRMADRFRPTDRVRVAGSTPLATATEIDAAATDRTRSFPAALKPATSAGNFGFTVVQSPAELAARAGELLTLTDPLGLPVERVLLQRYVPGVLYAPNITRHPRHGTLRNELWATDVELRDRQIVFRRTRLVRIDPRNPLHRRLFRAADAVGDGLQVQWGPVHPEFLWAPDGTLTFIDAGARPAGGTLTAVAARFGATDQITATLHGAFGPRTFQRLVRRGPSLAQEGALVYFASNRRGKVRSVPTEAEMRERIPGFQYAVLPNLYPGAMLGVSGNLFEQPGFVVVEGGDAASARAEQALRAWEAEDFYRLEP